MTKQRNSHDVFKNYQTFSHLQLAHHDDVAHSLSENISCCEIRTFHRKTFDSVRCSAYLGHESFILATAYIPSNSEECNKDFFDSLENARAHAHRDNITGVISVGKLTGSSFLWGVTRRNKSGQLLEQFVKNPEVKILNDGEYSFYSANRVSIIDLFIVTDSITSWNFSLYTDIELFTGYRNSGHVPVLVSFDISTKSSNRELNLTWKTLIGTNGVKL